MQLTDHFAFGDQGFTAQVAAALRVGLVFKLNSVGASALQQANTAHHVHGVAKAGIAIHDHG